jgi:hypothetical protein
VIGEFVIVRTYSAGVHMGTLRECNGTAVLLEDARRLWRWNNAFTLNEASQEGVGEESRISDPVPAILITQAIEVIPCSQKAKANLARSRNGERSRNSD